MKVNLTTLILIAILSIESMGQEVIELPQTKNSSSIPWTEDEKRFHSVHWNTEVVTNVSKATLLAYLPENPKSITSAMIICPGGGMYGHSIVKEGTAVAEWFQERGVAAFVLKYRLVPTGEDGTAEISEDWNNDVFPKAKAVLPLAASDAIEAIKLLRGNAKKYNIDPNQIGLMGFSAGGAVTITTTSIASTSERPNFIAPIYAWMDIVASTIPHKHVPPIFIACASDDPLQLAPSSVQLYKDWIDIGQSAELHMYAKGGHGFGMDKQGLSSDIWIDELGTWMTSNGWMPE